MSYSYSVSADTKEDAKKSIRAKLAGALASQPEHAADIPAVQDLCDSLIDALQDDPGMRVHITASGSVSYTTFKDKDEKLIRAIDATISVKYV